MSKGKKLTSWWPLLMLWAAGGVEEGRAGPGRRFLPWAEVRKCVFDDIDDGDGWKWPEWPF